MGCFDTVLIPCPDCGEIYKAQSKGGDCDLVTYELHNAPADVMSDVNRHAPFKCSCGRSFSVDFTISVSNISVS